MRSHRGWWATRWATTEPNPWRPLVSARERVHGAGRSVLVIRARNEFVK